MKSVQSLHLEITIHVKHYLNSESRLLVLLKEMDDRRGYLDLGYESLWKYAIQGLGLSESVAGTLIKIERASRKVPELIVKIEARKISVSNAILVAKVVTPENAESLLEKAENLSKRELGKELARIFPETPLRPEVITPKTETLTSVTLTLTQKEFDLLRRAQELTQDKKSGSGKQVQAMGLKDAIIQVAQDFVTRHDPIEKAVRARKFKTNAKHEAGEPEKSLLPGRVIIPAQLKHAVLVRDGAQCTYIDSQTEIRCPERKWLHTHHKVPVVMGGRNSLENLTLLCSAHHRLHHH